ncbi:protein Niban 1a [Chanos chanos]|uniref:Protein Niban 1a n=1 Tax=Chanos chanos TaxID=29144 RepID=A0A6J2V1B9_CHACN|nr:protein Niban 1-like [Chanos chanos]
MGISPSSLLDEKNSNFIRERTDAELKKFSPVYRKQFSLAYLAQVQDEMQQHEEKRTQLLKQRPPRAAGEVLYEEHVLYFDDNRKWRERYAVVRANYCLECHESYETFVKGAAPLQKLLPTGGTILTSEDKYMAMVDKCFPDTNNLKEDFAPPVAGMPGQFPVYLRLPYRRDSYFCFRQESRRTGFISILSDCIRHQNQDFLKKKTCEVKAFLKAIQLYRQESGHYESWDMLIGSDVRVLANLLMGALLPSLEKEMLPRLKAKKTEKKRVWFATVEAAYILVQGRLLEGLNALKEECRETAKRQEVLMRSDMDEIISSRTFLEGKLKTMVTEPTERYCSENVQPFLPAILEEIMGPISLGFTEARTLTEHMMDQLYDDFQQGGDMDSLKQALMKMSKADLESCYEKVSALKDHEQELQQRFICPNRKSLEHSTQIDIQQLVENAVYTFELLLFKSLEDNPNNLAQAIEKSKLRVLKQYDYDSSTVRKKIFHDALISITLPSIKKHLAPTSKEELPKYEQYIFANHTDFINVENVYEDILQQILQRDVSRVVDEAASLKKYNLFMESRDRFSLSSLPRTPPDSPVKASAFQRPSTPASPLLGNGLERFTEVTAATGAEVAEAGAEVAEAGAEVAGAEVTGPSETVATEVSGAVDAEEVNARPAVPAEGAVKREEISLAIQPETPDTCVAPDTEAALKSEAPADAAEPGRSSPSPEPVAVKGECIESQCLSTPAEAEAGTDSSHNGTDEITAPPAGKASNSAPATPTSVLLHEIREKHAVSAEACSDDASRVTEEEKVSEGTESGIEEGDPRSEVNESVTSDNNDITKEVIECAPFSPVDDTSAAQEDTEANADVTQAEHSKTTTEGHPTESQGQDPSPEESAAKPPDCVKAIRDLVVEVIEVEEVVQHYPGEEDDVV